MALGSIFTPLYQILNSFSIDATEPVISVILLIITACFLSYFLAAVTYTLVLVVLYMNFTNLSVV